MKDKKSTLGRWNESRYESTVSAVEKWHAKLKESEALGIHANQPKDFVSEEVVTAVIVIMEVLEREGHQRSIGSRDELFEAANREE